jgi:hypothetical protein
VNRSQIYRRVHQAIQKGVLLPLDGAVLCVDCGESATEYDHRDYAKPLEVDPVCGRCNRKRGPALNFVSATAPQKLNSLQQIRTVLVDGIGGIDKAVEYFRERGLRATRLQVMVWCSGMVNVAAQKGISRQTLCEWLKKEGGHLE